MSFSGISQKKCLESFFGKIILEINRRSFIKVTPLGALVPVGLLRRSLFRNHINSELTFLDGYFIHAYSFVSDLECRVKRLLIQQ